MEPGVEDILTVVCTNDKGDTSPPSNEVPITPPTAAALLDTPSIKVIEPVPKDNSYNITYVPPTGGSCTPTAYKVTSTAADGKKTTVTTPATKPYGTAPTEVQLKNLDLGTSYNVVCVGVCQPGAASAISEPIETTITTPEAAPLAPAPAPTPAAATPAAAPTPSVGTPSPGVKAPPPLATSPPPPSPKLSSPPPPAPLGVPVIDIPYPTGTTSGQVEFTPPEGVTNCTLYLNGTAYITVPAVYPTTLTNITGLLPGSETFVCVTCKTADGRTTNSSDKVPITPPKEQSAPTIKDVVVPSNPDDDFTFTINPPTEGNCKPVAYNVTYIPSGSNPRYYTVNATQPYGVAPTNISLSFIPGTLYTLIVAGICEDKTLTPATEIDIDVPAEEILGRPIIETVFPTKLNEAEVKFTPPAGVGNCTVFVDNKPVERVVAKYPTTSAFIAGLTPGKKVIVVVNCETDDGRTTNFSNEVAVTPPVKGTAPVIDKISVPDAADKPTLVTILPPDTGDCKPMQYNVTYQSAGSKLAYVVVDAAKTYGVAPTRVLLTKLSADSEYKINVVGICSPESKDDVTPPAEAVLIT